jgi:glycosyltransferase involved in cell wall biosynthesis
MESHGHGDEATGRPRADGGGRQGMSAGDPVLTVVIPVFNEAKTVLTVIERVRAAPVVKEIVVVDDGSTDGTRDLLATLDLPDVRVVLHDRNRGKGAALRTGFAAARGAAVVVQDADLEYDPAEYPVLLAPILDGRADAVFGSRFLGGAHRVLYFWHRVGNGFLTLLSNMVTNLNLSDMETCYKVVRRELLQSIPLREDRFGFEPEITCKLARAKARIYEVPVSYSGRTYEEGKKITWRDGFRAIWCIAKYGVMRR